MGLNWISLGLFEGVANDFRGRMSSCMYATQLAFKFVKTQSTLLSRDNLS